MVPTRDRHDMLRDCVDSIVEQVDTVLVIDNESSPAISMSQWPITMDRALVAVTRAEMDPPNISRLWNIGIYEADHEAYCHGAREWDVVVLNSDVVVPPGWVDALSAAMRATTAVLAYPDQCGGTEQILHTKAEPVDLRQRITGYAYMLRGEADLRLDESMVWHYSDDDLDWTARERGGALLVPGFAVEHRDPNGSMRDRPELNEQAARDRETFIAKWGRAPH
ncbi:glycosyltransferase family 2 protein [Streptomyces sp. Amel2xB2]|uniref:glycosyltransferase family 2 protein n=1 Tax=Streptomyces sp. Amel2xB2 TaxID=1305829 RepID=UPI0011B9472B|nr:glycosyltransferase [Streptomyces sp. Amel2xB2]